ncbi:DNA-binding protein [Maioricimonas rarisocia]|nr:DNA-binding protein [Maioricimonas rarisocia]
MAISVTLSDEQSRRLEEMARRLNVTPQRLATAAIREFLSRPSNDFDRAMQYVLQKNRELYRRLT